MATGSVQTPERVRVRRSPARENGHGNEEPVLLKSFLHKKGKRFKVWHQRYFEIQGTHMYYYKNSSKSDCLGKIDLSLCTFCGPIDEATFGSPFEIRTTLRTHAMSARSTEERDQWIEVICKQSKPSASATRSKDAAKPKRWKTFRNAIGINRHRKSQDNLLAADTPSKRGGIIFGRFRRKASRPTLRQAHTESNLHNDRPLSMIEDSMAMVNLEQMLDVKPSRSLPSTPLTRRRSNPLIFPRAGNKVDVVDPMMTLPATLTTLSVIAPGEHSDNEDAEDPPVIEFVPPPFGFRDNSPNDMSGDEGVKNGESSELTSLDTTLEAPASSVSSDPYGSGLSSVTAANENGDVNMAMPSKSAETEEVLDRNGSSVEIPAVPIIVSSPDDVIDRKPYVVNDKAWEEIRAVLAEESNDLWNNVVPLSYNILPKQEEQWKNMSSGVEGLRAFLDMSD